MDPRLLAYYNRELAFMREMGGEFSKEFPKIAGRLGLDGFECADPYVERLLEGFAFLAARVQLKIDAEFPRFTQSLLEMVYPHYLAPTPAMAVVQFTPDLAGAPLNDGFLLPRDSVLRSPLARGEQTACEFRTAHDVTLWPVALSDAKCQTYAREMGAADTAVGRSARSALRLRLKALAGLTFDKIPMDRLNLFLRGGELAARLYEGLLAGGTGVIVRTTQSGPGGVQELLGKEAIRRVGFEQKESLLPYGPRSFQGYRLLHEYFAFPERFLFVEIAGLLPILRRCHDSEIEISVLMDRADPGLLNAVDASHLALFCTPAINLFPRRCDPIQLEERFHEYHLVPDRTVPLDLEVYDVTKVVGAGAGGEGEREFLPFYGGVHGRSLKEEAAYYTVRRAPYVPSQRARDKGPRSSYVGGEVYLSLVDPTEAPIRTGLRHLSVTARCTNRDLTLQLAPGQGRTDFTLQSSAPVGAIRCIAGPSRPYPSRAEGETAWRLVSHLSLNYLSLADTDPAQGAAALRELLMLYGGDTEASMRLQVEGVRSVQSSPITRVLSTPAGPAMGRGLQVDLLFDEAAFAGSGAYLLGSVLERFFARHVSINSFTETVLRSQTRGEITRWPARIGNREIL